MTRYEIIDFLVEEAVEDKEIIKENLKKVTDNCTIEVRGYKLEIKLSEVK